jgi:hypothetical protein
MLSRRAVVKQRAFLAIFSTMLGVVEIARMLSEPAMREKALGSAREFLLRSFLCPRLIREVSVGRLALQSQQSRIESTSSLSFVVP